LRDAAEHPRESVSHAKKSNTICLSMTEKLILPTFIFFSFRKYDTNKLSVFLWDFTVFALRHF
jgi:hypothetical protein